ncbi:MAG: multidrug transporter [Rhodospirillaceae bacterium]|nr:multidrug transporter [Rhodospirillaceae bacterium]
MSTKTSSDARVRPLLEGPISPMLLRLAGPNVVAVSLMTAVTIGDALFVGYLGTVPLASLALVFPFQTLMQMMSAGAIGGGATSSVARALGGGSREQAAEAAWHAVIIGVLGALLYMVVLGFFARPIFALLGGTGEALEGAVIYAAIAFGGATATWAFYLLSAILRGTGDTVTPARAIVVGCAVQVPLSGILTLGWGPFSGFGIAGPAIAMVVCHGGASLYLALCLHGNSGGVRLRPYRVRWAPVLDILKVGGIGLINSVTVAVSVVIVTGVVGRYGTEALAGYGLGARLELTLTPIAFGIGAALTAAVGVNVGAEQFSRARRIAWVGAGMTFLITGLIGLVAALFPSLWLDWFTNDPAVYGFGLLYLAIVAPFYGVFGGGQALYFASQGTGHLVWPVGVGVLRFLVVSGVGVVALALGWPLEAVFAGVSAGLLVTGIGLALCLLGPDWRPRQTT